MNTTCICLRNGYERSLKVGESYTVLDIQYGIFEGDYYVTVDTGNSKKATALLYRFDLTKEIAESFIKLKDLL